MHYERAHTRRSALNKSQLVSYFYFLGLLETIQVTQNCQNGLAKNPAKKLENFLKICIKTYAIMLSLTL